MDRRLILAVAGSGKTTFLMDKLNSEKRFLIITYTENNLAHIRQSIISRFGYIPDNITTKSYYQFLLQDCYRPFLRYDYRDNGITWEIPDAYTMKLSRESRYFYLTQNGLLYHNRIAKMCQQNGCSAKIKGRIEMFYDYLMVDEVQDLGGHDFNLMLSIIPDINCLFVGDFYQHTFDTSKDGNVNKSLYDNYQKYKKLWKKAGVVVDETTLQKSYRCSNQTCDFVRTNLGIEIYSHSEKDAEIKWIDSQEEADVIFRNDNIIKLFYDNSSKYRCYSENWGKCKGLDRFVDICVVINATTKRAFEKSLVGGLPSSTKNKLYVACTRARGDIYLVSDCYYKKYKL